MCVCGRFCRYLDVWVQNQHHLHVCVCVCGEGRVQTHDHRACYHSRSLFVPTLACRRLSMTGSGSRRPSMHHGNTCAQTPGSHGAAAPRPLGAGKSPGDISWQPGISSGLQSAGRFPSHHTTAWKPLRRRIAAGDRRSRPQEWASQLGVSCLSSLSRWMSQVADVWVGSLLTR